MEPSSGRLPQTAAAASALSPPPPAVPSSQHDAFSAASLSPSSPSPSSPPLPPLPSYVPAHLSPPRVLQLLQQAQDTDGAVRREASDCLQSAARQLGYRTACLYIALSVGAVSDALRLLAVIQLKNSVDGWFSAPASDGLSGEQEAARQSERELLKAALLSRLSDPDDRVATQLAVVVAAIARYQSGRAHWPQLLPALLSGLSSSSSLLALRSAFALHSVLKTLQAKRTPMARQAFAAVAVDCLPTVAALCLLHSRSLCRLLADAAGPLSEQSLQLLTTHSRMASITLKAASRLAVYGLPDVGQSADCRQLVSGLLEVCRFLLPVRASIPQSTSLHSPVSALLMSIVRLLLSAQCEQPLPFRHFLPDAVQAADFLLSRAHDGAGELSFEPLTVCALQLLVRVLREPLYAAPPPAGSEAPKQRSALSFSLSGGLKAEPQAAAEARSIVASCLPSSLVLQLSRLLVLRFFPLTPQERQRWTEDADAAIMEAEQGDDGVRPCGLQLLSLCLTATQHGRAAAAALLDLLQQVSQHSIAAAAAAPSASPLPFPSSPPPAPTAPAPADDVALLTAKSAVYLALGACSAALRETEAGAGFDFPSFFQHVLRPELLSCCGGPAAAAPALSVSAASAVSSSSLSSSSSPSSSSSSSSPPSVHRRELSCRLLWLLGEWCERLPLSLLPEVLHLTGAALEVGDVMVRYSAARCLERVVSTVVAVDDSRRGQRALAAVVERLLPLLFSLISQLQELHNANRVLQVVRETVSALGSSVQPAVPCLLSALPALWSACASSNNLLRLTLLETMTELTAALGNRSLAVQHFCLQAVAFCLAADAQQDRSFMHLDALRLLQSVVEQSPTFSAELMAAFALVLRCLHDADWAGGGGGEGGSADWLSVSLRLLESFSLLGGRQLMSAYAAPVSSLLQQWMSRVGDGALISISDVLETLCQLFPSEFPSAFQSPLLLLLRRCLQPQQGQADLLTANLLFVLARLVVVNHDGFMAALALCAADGSREARLQCLLSLLGVWLDKLDCVAELYKRRLSVLAVGRLLVRQQHSDDARLLPFVVLWLIAATGVQAELDRQEEGEGEGRWEGAGGGGSKPAQAAHVNGNGVSEAEQEDAAAAQRRRQTEWERRQQLADSDPAREQQPGDGVLAEALQLLAELQSRSAQSQPQSAFSSALEQQLPAPIKQAMQLFQQRRQQQLQQQRSSAAPQLPSPSSATLPAPLTAAVTQHSAFSFPPPSLPTSHSHPSLHSLLRPPAGAG